ncbi:unnamed protein product [Ranitomeya imitator]|uniref:Retrotransposon gag domain-containing protein n=1 Tax=Ranitomeya imitator TaxID=111125 RepID=A0ABN9MMM0_9NEOB|nr:unnamed protein product [Ranitomeya imitator]
MIYKEKWTKIPYDICANLIINCEKRLSAVLANKGFATKTMPDLMWLECQQFLQDEGIEAMDWPAHSPDVNPIDQIWDIMSRTIHQHHIAPQTVQELADALVQVWEEIPQETIHRLTRSMPQALINIENIYSETSSNLKRLNDLQNKLSRSSNDDSLHALKDLEKQLEDISQKKKKLSDYLCEELAKLSLEDTFGTMKTFRDHFLKARKALGLLYDEPNSVDQAEKNLLALCQGQDDVEVYCQKFRKWSVLTLWNESALAALFRKGLSEALKDVMVGFPMPAGLNESMSLAIQIGRRLRERKSVHHLAVLSESKPEPMQCDRTMTKSRTARTQTSEQTVFLLW